MSGIEVTYGTATVSIAPVYERVETDSGTPRPYYGGRDLLDATCAALLAINTTQTRAWAGAIYELTKDIR